jgi:MFS family permease
MRGRVMALYSIVFLGSTPIGGPICGWLAEAGGPRSALVLAGAAAIVGAIGLKLGFKARPTSQSKIASGQAEVYASVATPS